MLLDLFSEPDIFGIKWDALTQYNGALYPALPDLYGPTMNVRHISPASSQDPMKLWCESPECWQAFVMGL